MNIHVDNCTNRAKLCYYVVSTMVVLLFCQQSAHGQLDSNLEDVWISETKNKRTTTIALTQDSKLTAYVRDTNSNTDVELEKFEREIEVTGSNTFLAVFGWAKYEFALEFTPVGSVEQLVISSTRTDGEGYSNPIRPGTYSRANAKELVLLGLELNIRNAVEKKDMNAVRAALGSKSAEVLRVLPATAKNGHAEYAALLESEEFALRDSRLKLAYLIGRLATSNRDIALAKLLFNLNPLGMSMNDYYHLAMYVEERDERFIDQLSSFYSIDREHAYSDEQLEQFEYVRRDLFRFARIKFIEEQRQKYDDSEFLSDAVQQYVLEKLRSKYDSPIDLAVIDSVSIPGVNSTDLYSHVDFLLGRTTGQRAEKVLYYSMILALLEYGADPNVGVAAWRKTTTPAEFLYKYANHKSYERAHRKKKNFKQAASQYKTELMLYNKLMEHLEGPSYVLPNGVVPEIN